jgi:hypothetical protein
MEHESEKINERHVKIDLFQVYARKFISNIQRHVVMGCKLFLFQYQVILILRSTSLKELIGHSKDQGKVDLNSRTNSFHPGETDGGELDIIFKEYFGNKINTRMERICNNI